MSRATWHRIEAGEPSVTWGAVLNALAAVGLSLKLQGAEPAAKAWPAIRVGDYPGLRAALAWQLHEDTLLSLQDWQQLLARNERHLDEAALQPQELALLHRLRSAHV